MENNEAIGILNGMARNCRNMPRGYEDPDREIKQEALSKGVAALESQDIAENAEPLTNARWLQMQKIPLNSVQINSTGFSIAGETYHTDAGCDDEEEALEAFLEWLDKEHEEDILTALDRKLLIKILSPVRDKVYYIIRHRINGITSLELIHRTSRRCRRTIGNVPVSSESFKGMKDNTYYRVEDLNL